MGGGLKFWTVAYVSIQDWRLGVAYYGGAFLVLCYAVWSVVINRGYLELEPVQGVCRPTLLGAPSNPLEPRCPNGRNCKPVSSEDLEEGVSLGQAFVATRVVEVLERCTDTFCLGPRKVEQELEFYPENLQNYILSVACNAQAFRFYSEECHRRDLARAAVSQELLLPPSRLRGAPVMPPSYERRTCPFAAANLRSHGRLLDPTGEVIHHIHAGTEDVFSIRTWLQAAGVSLDHRSDAPGATPMDSLRTVGAVFVVNFNYHNHPTEASMYDYFFQTHRGGIEYDIEVQQVAEAGYHLYGTTVNENLNTANSSTRELTLSYGLLFRFMQSGTLGRFSWSAFCDQLVLKLGMLSVLQVVIDVFWQYVLPAVTTSDYNSQVYRWYANNANRPTPTVVGSQKEIDTETTELKRI